MEILKKPIKSCRQKCEISSFKLRDHALHLICFPNVFTER